HLPARVVVVDGNDQCHSDTRTIYDATSSQYYNPPEKGLVAKTAQAINTCTATDMDVNHNTPDRSPEWLVSHMTYDGKGNLTKSVVLGQNNGEQQGTAIRYDDVYQLFPTKQTNVNNSSYYEEADYYGVSSGYHDTTHGVWGSMARHCGSNGLCTVQTTDSFGRPIRRTNAANPNIFTVYEYFEPNYFKQEESERGNRKTYVVSEWQSPRCEGNFVRKHYNGLGQLVAEQHPAQGWQIAIDGCGTGARHPEVDTYYKYDSLGRQTHVSVPVAKDRTTDTERIWTDVNTYDWRDRYRQTSYDSLSRPILETAPNYVQTSIHYAGFATSVIRDGKVIKWTETDALGNLHRVRNYEPSGSRWVEAGTVTLNHDMMGHLESVVHADGAGNTYMTYDLLGRKTGMNDVDMGLWYYNYDHFGNLTSQLDARDVQTHLGYDRLGRLYEKRFSAYGDSPSYTINYTYDDAQNSGGQGQLTSVQYSDNRYAKHLTYNALGLLQNERVTMPNITTNSDEHFTTSYGYDEYNRLVTTIHPDGERVLATYNSMGLQETLISQVGSQQTVLVNNVNYDEAGRLVEMSLPAISETNPIVQKYQYYPWVTQTNGGFLQNILVAQGNATYLNLSYTYDKQGNINSIIDPLNGPTQSFAYDNQNRLTSAYGQSFAWMPSGNIRSFATEGNTYTYHANHPHAVEEVNGVNYDYDNNGNLTSRTGGDNPLTLTWNAENRLAHVAGNEISERYVYNSDGIRVQKSSSSQITHYVNDVYEVAIHIITPTPTATNTPRPTATNTPTRRPTATPRPTSTFTRRPPTATPRPTSTFTRRPPTATPRPTSTFTRRPPTATPRPTSTFTRRPPTATPRPTSTFTRRPPTATPRPTSTFTRRPPTATPRPTATFTRRPTSTPRPTATFTRRPTSTPRPTATFTRRPTSPPATLRPTSTLTPRPTATRNLITNIGQVCTALGCTPVNNLSTTSRGATALNVISQTVFMPLIHHTMDGAVTQGARSSVDTGSSSSQTEVYMPLVMANEPVTSDTRSSVNAASNTTYKTVITKYYTFNGQRIAMKRSDEFTYLHGDHLGSTSVTITDQEDGDDTSEQRYYAFGGVRSGGDLPTDFTYTGQKVDGTGLMYYRARYYDPEIGLFISPDSIVPDETNVFDYNRYMYVAGNPLKFNDPTGHCKQYRNNQATDCSGPTAAPISGVSISNSSRVSSSSTATQRSTTNQSSVLTQSSTATQGSRVSTNSSNTNNSPLTAHGASSPNTSGVSRGVPASSQPRLSAHNEAAWRQAYHARNGPWESATEIVPLDEVVPIDFTNMSSYEIEAILDGLIDLDGRKGGYAGKRWDNNGNILPYDAGEVYDKSPPLPDFGVSIPTRKKLRRIVQLRRGEELYYTNNHYGDKKIEEYHPSFYILPTNIEP
ncbi:MAG: RHS repeat-associated core domain-containing protein, partial [Chloroflexota bacterium]